MMYVLKTRICLIKKEAAFYTHSLMVELQSFFNERKKKEEKSPAESVSEQFSYWSEPAEIIGILYAHMYL